MYFQAMNKLIPKKTSIFGKNYKMSLAKRLKYEQLLRAMLNTLIKIGFARLFENTFFR